MFEKSKFVALITLTVPPLIKEKHLTKNCRITKSLKVTLLTSKLSALWVD